MIPKASVPKILGVSRFKPSHGEWRLGTPLRAVHDAGLAITCHMNWGEVVVDDGWEELTGAALSSDLVVMQGPHNEGSRDWIKMLQNPSQELIDEGFKPVKVAVDLDDHPFVISPMNSAYGKWGSKEHTCVIGDRIFKKWEDCGDCEKCRSRRNSGGSPKCFNIKRNRNSRRRWLSCVKQSDALIVTNKRLGKKVRRFKTWSTEQPIYTIPNLLNMRTWNRITRVYRPSPIIRIGWHGGWSHIEDLMMVKPAIKAILEKYPNVKLVMFGWISPFFTEGLDSSQIEFHQWEDGTEAFVSRLKSSQVDIGIAPVVPGEFADCKSELKWVEYGSQGIPVVATAAHPYIDKINFAPGDDPNWNGLLALTTEEWIGALTFLIENEAARRGIGENAYAHVLEHYDAAKRAPEIMSVYQRILDGDLPEPVSGNGKVVRAGRSLHGVAH